MKKLIFLLLLGNCTTIGFHDTKLRKSIDFGKSAVIRLCVLKDVRLQNNKIKELINNWNKELDYYNLKIEISNLKEWERPALFSSDIFREVMHHPIEKNCDRLLGFVAVNFGDYFFELLSYFIPTFMVLGTVDTATHTKGYIMAENFSIVQLIIGGPKSTLVHEGYHLLGCGHFSMKNCYNQISKLKKLSQKNRASKIDFFPALTEDSRVYTNREDVNLIFERAFPK
ncbi:MAG: hypothetical protein H7A23_15020 [Leptospiraceae bacterium]|nr:hypothetical protein [Leptospiraceae bacterium]MCP5495863.1 hypothetical protein [Leptospiraceae bacterium]